MLKLNSTTHFSDVLAVLHAKRDAIALDLAELKSEGVSVIDVDPADMLLMERCGYIVCVESGRILAGPAQLVL